MLSSARDALVALAFPSFCQVCASPIDLRRDGSVCSSCWAQSSWPADARLCKKCGGQLASPAQERCGWCDGLSFAMARACGPYTIGWRETVLWLKRHPQIAQRVVDELSSCLALIDLRHSIDLLLPIPLHPERERQRGFNQAQVIAQALTERTRVPVDLASVKRISQTTRHRAGMDASQRARSLKGAFRVRAPRGIVGRGIVIVDDVMTTSATANEVSSVLMDAGARAVSVLTIARVAAAPLWGKRLALSLAD